MEKAHTRNDLNAAVPKFCLTVEEHRRTADGRVRVSQEFLTHFFPYDEKVSSDRVFVFMPRDVRGPVLAAWGIRGAKAAMRDPDEKVQSVVHDALVAGDIDHAAFEDGLEPTTLITWVPLADWWAFWRGGKLSKNAILKALVTGYELGLFDAKWFLETIEARQGKLRGTDVISEGLSKDDLTEWMRRIHESGDGSAKGIIAAIGWDKIVAKTTNDVLVSMLDAMVVKVGLVKPPPSDPKPEGRPQFESRPPETAKPGASVAPGAPEPARADAREKKSEAPADAKADAARPPAQGSVAPLRLSEPPPASSDIDWADTSDLKGRAATLEAIENTISQLGEPMPADHTSDDMIVVMDDDLDGGGETIAFQRDSEPGGLPRRTGAPRALSQEELEETTNAEKRKPLGGRSDRPPVVPAPPRPGSGRR